MADLVVSEGYAALGYEYINVDDCWLEKSRGPRGELVADRRRFPSGMKALGDYVSIQCASGVCLQFGDFSQLPFLSIDSCPRTQVRHLRRLRQLHVCRISGYIRLLGAGLPTVCRLGSGLREIGRLLFAAHGNGLWISGIRTHPERHRTADGVLVQLARLPNIRGHLAQLLVHHRTLQLVAQLRRHPRLVGLARDYHRLLRQQSGGDCPQCGTRSLERSRHADYRQLWPEL